MKRGSQRIRYLLCEIHAVDASMTLASTGYIEYSTNIKIITKGMLQIQRKFINACKMFMVMRYFVYNNLNMGSAVEEGLKFGQYSQGYG